MLFRSQIKTDSSRAATQRPRGKPQKVPWSPGCCLYKAPRYAREHIRETARRHFNGAGGRSRGLGSLLRSLSPQLALPHLRKSRGNVINISSLVGAIGQSQAVPYVATKVHRRDTLPLPPGVSALRYGLRHGHLAFQETEPGAAGGNLQRECDFPLPMPLLDAPWLGACVPGHLLSRV